VIYPKPNSTLLQIISLAGGLRELGDSTKILVYSPETKTGRDSRVFNIERIREGKDPDPQLIAGNVVVVEESGSRALMYGIGRFARSIFSFGAMQNPMQ
jgi:protein involved in polysaccharide export with SLBB domain